MNGSLLRHLCAWTFTLLAYGSCIAIVVLFATQPLSKTTFDHHNKLAEIQILHPWLANTLFWLAAIVAVTLGVVSLFSFYRRRLLRVPIIGMLISSLTCPFCLTSDAVHNMGPWTVHGSVRTNDGTLFVFCDSSFLQGQTMAIARVGKTTRFWTTYHVLVDNNGDSPRSWASIIRPADSTDTYGQLYLSPNNTLLGVRYDNCCFLAYQIDQQLPIGHGDIECISPFLCIGPDTDIRTSDVDLTMKEIREFVQWCATSHDVRHATHFLAGERVPGCPPVALVRSSLQHANPQVRSAAQRILDCYAEADEQLRRRVSRDP